MRTPIHFAIASALCFIVISVNAQTTIIVEEGQSIQDAINSASNGDTIQVAEGVFDESLFINKRIVLLGQGPAKSVITGGDNGSRAYDERRTILVYSKVTIRGFTITQNSTVVDSNHNTMGILLEAAGRSKIQNCAIKNHITGIYISGSENNLIEDNLFTHCGNGVLMASHLFDTDDNRILNNRFSGNGVADEKDDAGIKLISNYSGSNNEVTLNDIVDNTIGINNLTQNILYAVENWWGAPSGPYNSTNPDGSGNSVSGYVIFENWSEQEINPALSVNDAELDFSLDSPIVYPNPAVTGRVNIEFEATGYAPGSIIIMDVTGKQAKYVDLGLLPAGKNRATLDVSDIESGLYVIVLDLNSNRLTSRLIIQN